MEDETEAFRRERVAELNAPEDERVALEERYGKVWNTDEMSSDFEVLGFYAPYIMVIRKSDRAKGSLEFQHMPRYYFNFKSEE